MICGLEPYIQQDSTWTSCSNATGNAYYRVVNGIVYIKFYPNSVSASSYTAIGVLPEAVAPTTQLYFNIWADGTNNLNCLIRSRTDTSPREIRVTGNYKITSMISYPLEP